MEQKLITVMKRNVRQISKKNVLIAAIACMLHAGIIQAQDTITVSLSKALEIAMSESPTIKVANKEIERVSYSKKERQGGLLPVVSLSAAYQRAVKKQKMYLDGFDMSGFVDPQSVYLTNILPQALGLTVPDAVKSGHEAYMAAMTAPRTGDGSIEVGRDNTFTSGLSASLPLVAPTLWATLKMSDIELEAVNESARASKISLYNQVTKAYYGILLAQDSYDVIKRSYNNTIENSKIIYNKYKQGTVSEFEWIRADVQVKNALSNVVSAESGVNMGKLQLKMLMGIDMYTELNVEGKLSDFESTMYGDVMQIDTAKLGNNSDLKLFSIQQKQLNQSLKVHEASLLPVLAASFNYQFMSMANDSGTFTKSQKWFPMSTLGVSLSVPIFQGGSKYYKSKQIKVQLNELDFQKANLERSIQLQSISYMDNIKKSLKKIDSNKEGLRQAEKAVAISKKMYEVGSSTYLDFSNAELAYIQAGLMYNQSIFDYLSAKADLEKLLGKETVK
ncbi:MAG TPA: TolC family protein [Paludibacter sp.]|nr:TolC family protein [Paludibacter sp.]